MCKFSFFITIDGSAKLSAGDTITIETDHGLPFTTQRPAAKSHFKDNFEERLIEKDTFDNAPSFTLYRPPVKVFNGVSLSRFINSYGDVVKSRIG